MPERPTILLVDDEPKVLELITFRLQLLGYRVITATCGEDAIALADKHRPNLVILDVTMPGMDGLSVCTRLREAETTAEIPIVMLTARSEVEDVNKAMAAGANDYVVKPYDAAVLQMKIRRQLGTCASGSQESRSNT